MASTLHPTAQSRCSPLGHLFGFGLPSEAHWEEAYTGKEEGIAPEETGSWGCRATGAPTDQQRLKQEGAKSKKQKNKRAGLKISPGGVISTSGITPG